MLGMVIDAPHWIGRSACGFEGLGQRASAIFKPRLCRMVAAVVGTIGSEIVAARRSSIAAVPVSIAARSRLTLIWVHGARCCRNSLPRDQIARVSAAIRRYSVAS